MKWSYKAAIAVSAVALAAASAGSAVAATGSAPAGHVTKAAVGSPINVAGIWGIAQSNSASGGTMHLNEDPVGNLSGYAVAQDSSGATITGTVEAGSQVDGNFIIFTLDWPSGARGRYTGALESDGTLYGATLNLANTVAQATWWTYQTF